MNSLPIYWKIRRDVNTYESINLYMNTIFNVTGYWAKDGYVNNRVPSANEGKDCIEITFEQFEQLVLNKQKGYELW